MWGTEVLFKKRKKKYITKLLFLREESFLLTLFFTDTINLTFKTQRKEKEPVQIAEHRVLRDNWTEGLENSKIVSTVFP